MNFLYLTILFPLLGFLLLAFSRGRWSENTNGVIGVGSVGLSLIITILIMLDYLSKINNNDMMIFSQMLWRWISIENFNIDITLRLDALSLVMLLVITGVGFCIHLYASWYMHGEDGYSRFFAYTNLFISSMIILVLADNLLLMYLGWEIVGLCSYLLIGFYYLNPKNGAAAMKAFITTRVGDVIMLIGLFTIYKYTGTLNFHDTIECLSQQLTNNPTIITWITLMLLGGAIGKSAQIPLQTWLVDAMAGPTPVSALIHAATMVTAGVYLIARMYDLFIMVPEVLYLVGIIGATTLILASFSALVQTDIKRILAYSTMSQIGYMFVALGVQAWSAAIFHLITHACFKALLFLSSGSIILACYHEQNIFRMGRLCKSMPFIYICFLIGGSALSALPLLTSGFYSKEAILLGMLTNNNKFFILVGLIGAFLTSIYTFRMIFIIFHRKEKINIKNIYYGINHNLPLIILLILSTVVGIWIISPLVEILQMNNFHYDHYQDKSILEVISSIVTLIAIYLTAILWLKRYHVIQLISISKFGKFCSLLWLHAWGFDWLYKKIFIKSYLAIAKLIACDPLNIIMNIPAILIRWLGLCLVISENGKLRWYITSMSLGAIIIISLLLILI